MELIEYQLVEHTPELFSYFVLVDKDKVGWIHIKIDNEIAVINDIKIRDIFSCRFRFLPFFKKKISYRKRGFGSCLIKKAIEKCRKLKVVGIKGDMYGNRELLTRFYTKNRFKIIGNSIYYKI